MMNSGFLNIIVFVTGDNYNCTSAQTCHICYWLAQRETASLAGRCVGAGYCCLVLLLQSLRHRGWRASPKRLTCSSKYSSSLRLHKPKLTSRSLGITGTTHLLPPMILMCLIFMFQTQETNPADLFDHFTCMHFTSLSKMIQVAWK